MKDGRVRWALVAILLAGSCYAAWTSYRNARARQHLRSARIALERRDVDLAWRHVQDSRDWWEHRWDGRLLAAKAARLAGHFDEAEQHVVYCESHAAPGAQQIQAKLERALLQVHQGDWQDHLKRLTPLGLEDPFLSVDVLEAAVHGFMNSGIAPSASYCLERLLQLNTKQLSHHALAGKMHAMFKQPVQAIAHLEQAVLDYPQAFEPRLELVEQYILEGRLLDCASHLAILERDFPANVRVLMAQAQLHAFRMETDKAKTALDKILKQQPDHDGALLKRGQLELLLGEPKLAQAWFEHATRADPGSLQAWLSLEHCYAQLGLADQATRARKERTELQTALGRLTLRAIAAKEKATDAAALFDLANQHERLHNSLSALRWRFRTLQVDPKHRPTRQALAQYYQRLGQANLAARQEALAKEL